MLNKEEYQIRWDKKKVLRKIYKNLGDKMLAESIPGLGLEVGSGISNFKANFDEKIIRMDVQKAKGLDVVADAHFLPFRDELFSKIFLFDVLHHLDCPLVFFSEANRVLSDRGRIIMIEPGITPISKIFYKMFHQEPVEMNWEPKKNCIPDSNKDPYDSNQAIPTLLFYKYNKMFDELNISFKIVKKNWISLFAYPLSGGFRPWSLIPSFLLKPVLKFEDFLIPIFGPLMAFRLIIVLEKNKKV